MSHRRCCDCKQCITVTIDGLVDAACNHGTLYNTTYKLPVQRTAPNIWAQQIPFFSDCSQAAGMTARITSRDVGGTVHYFFEVRFTTGNLYPSINGYWELDLGTDDPGCDPSAVVGEEIPFVGDESAFNYGFDGTDSTLTVEIPEDADCTLEQACPLCNPDVTGYEFDVTISDITGANAVCNGTWTLVPCYAIVRGGVTVYLPWPPPTWVDPERFRYLCMWGFTSEDDDIRFILQISDDWPTLYFYHGAASANVDVAAEFPTHPIDCSAIAKSGTTVSAFSDSGSFDWALTAVPP